MNHVKILESSKEILKARGEKYGELRANFKRIGLIAGQILGKDISAYDIAIIMHALKLSRIRESPEEMDHYIDGINYLSFAGEFSSEKPEPEDF